MLGAALAQGAGSGSADGGAAISAVAAAEAGHHAHSRATEIGDVMPLARIQKQSSMFLKPVTLQITLYSWIVQLYVAAILLRSGHSALPLWRIKPRGGAP